jgi:hypothetical protein
MTDSIVKEALDAYEESESVFGTAYKKARDDIEFARLSKQWPDAIKKQRDAEGRPCLTSNQLQPTIRQVVNDARLNRPSITVHPVDGKADKETAEVLTGLIRNIQASSDADVAYDTGVEAAVGGGFGYWKIDVDFALNALDEDGIQQAGESAFDKNLFIRPIPNQFGVFGDPYSEAADSSDWMTALEFQKLSKKRFKERFPGAEEANFDLWSSVQAPWIDKDDVQVCAYWKREKIAKTAYLVQLVDTEAGPGDVVIMFEDQFKAEGELITSLGGQVVGERPVQTYKVTQHVVSAMEELDKVDWAGSYIPIIPVYGDEVNLEGVRHFRSLIRDAKDDQQMLNFWLTSATEQVALAPKVPYLAEEGALVDHAKWSTANRQSHAYLEYKRGMQMPQRQPPVPVEAGIIQMAMTASDRIKANTGIYDASLGARSNETSGVAIDARDRQGDVATFHFIDNLTRAIRHSGRIIVDLIPKVYSTPRIVRILGEDGASDEKQLNQQFKDAQGIIRIHDVRVGQYDVTVTSGPSYSSRRQEAAAQMMDLVRTFPDAAPVIGDLLAKNLDWPGADEIAKRLEKLLPPGIKDDQGQVPPEVQQQMQQMGEALQVFQQQLQQAQAALADAKDDKDIKRAEAATKQYQAETARIAATSEAMSPEVVQQIVIQVLQDLATPNDLPSPEATAPMMDPMMGQAA